MKKKNKRYTITFDDYLKAIKKANPSFPDAPVPFTSPEAPAPPVPPAGKDPVVVVTDGLPAPPEPPVADTIEPRDDVPPVPPGLLPAVLAEPAAPMVTDCEAPIVAAETVFLA